MRQDLDFQEDEILERTLPNGRLEEYVITDVSFTSGMGGMDGIPSYFQLEARRKDKPLEISKPNNVTYNLHGHNSRVNVHSNDHSHNIVGLSASDVFSGIEAAVSEAVENQQHKREILTALQALKAEEGKPGFTKRYTEFMGTLADTITVVTPFLPALAQMLPIG